MEKEALRLEANRQTNRKTFRARKLKMATKMKVVVRGLRQAYSTQKKRPNGPCQYIPRGLEDLLDKCILHNISCRRSKDLHAQGFVTSVQECERHFLHAALSAPANVSSQI